MSNFNITLDIVERECPTCHITYFITAKHDGRLRTSGEGFYCPNGHPASFKDTETNRLRALVKRHEQSINELLHEKAELQKVLRWARKPPRKRKAKKPKEAE